MSGNDQSRVKKDAFCIYFGASGYISENEHPGIRFVHMTKRNPVIAVNDAIKLTDEELESSASTGDENQLAIAVFSPLKHQQMETDKTLTEVKW